MTGERSDAPGSRPNAILPHAQPEQAPTDHQARAEAYRAERDAARADLAALTERVRAMAAEWGDTLQTESRIMTTAQRGAWTDALRDVRALLPSDEPDPTDAAPEPKPAAEVHEFLEDVHDGSMCMCGVPALTHDLVYPAPAAGADTEEGSG